MKEQQTPLTADVDYYKFTMGDVIYDRHPDALVTFTFHNRNTHTPLTRYIDPQELAEQFADVQQNGFCAEEIGYLAGLAAQDGSARFTAAYLDHLADATLPDITVATNPQTGDLAIQTTGPWNDVSLWETVVMSRVNELYYRNVLQAHNLSLDDLYQEGDRRLDEKIAILKQHPDIRFADFGTRRRFSTTWHEHVIGRLARELPDQFIGTSNPWFAHVHNLAPIGTFAHEMPMVYAGLADAAGEHPLDGQQNMLRDWENHYHGDLSIALTDTFGSDVFLHDLSTERAQHWRGVRHDSGDPIMFGERIIDAYVQHDIDPREKTIIFSDGLDVAEIVRIHDYFKGRVQLLFGWGTNLMNDLGLPANNFVMKATDVNGTPTVKLSDTRSKYTGPETYVARYTQLVAARLGSTATRQVAA